MGLEDSIWADPPKKSHKDSRFKKNEESNDVKDENHSDRSRKHVSERGPKIRNNSSKRPSSNPLLDRIAPVSSVAHETASPEHHHKFDKSEKPHTGHTGHTGTGGSGYRSDKGTRGKPEAAARNETRELATAKHRIAQLEQEVAQLRLENKKLEEEAKKDFDKLFNAYKKKDLDWTDFED